jgi:small subunit ribosomal protein S3
MIERKIVNDRMKEFMIQSYVSDSLQNVGYSMTKVQKTPLGEKIIIYASRPGLIVGRKGLNIKTLTKNLKHKFKLENPQIEINEITNPNIDAQIVAEKIQSTLERFGSKRFKGVGHKSMEDVMKAGAMGCEILISGKIPSSRAKRWRFYQGYLKKSGDIAVSKVAVAYTSAQLKSGTVGIQVRIMLPDTKLPDIVELKKIEVIEDLNAGTKEETVTEVKSEEVKKVKETAEKLKDVEVKEKPAKEEKKSKKAPAKKTTKKAENKKE